jgi:hypothetical protein
MLHRSSHGCAHLVRIFSYFSVELLSRAGRLLWREEKAPRRTINLL